MTPAQIDSLNRMWAKENRPADEATADAPSNRGTSADLLAFASMPLGG